MMEGASVYCGHYWLGFKQVSVRSQLSSVFFTFSHSTELHPLLLLPQLAEEELCVQESDVLPGLIPTTPPAPRNASVS